MADKHGAKPERRAEPYAKFHRIASEAEPRCTSGGRADAKDFWGKAG